MSTISLLKQVKDNIMKKYLTYFLAIFCLTIFETLHAQSIKELEYSIFSSFQTPGPSPQGLAWDSTNIWLADDSTDTIYKINPTDGSVLYYFDSPGPEPKGLTYDGSHLYNLDDSLKKVFRIDETHGEVIDTIALPDIRDGPNNAIVPFWGLTWDGKNLYTNYEAGWSSQIIKLQLIGDSTSHFAFTNGYAKDLTFDGKYIWSSSDSEGHRLGWVSQYDSNGMRLNSFDAPGYYPTGITYDSTFFWLTDNEKDSLYCFQLLPTNIKSEPQFKNPSGFILNQNYPNPFNATTIISFSIYPKALVSLEIYNSQGQRINALKNIIIPNLQGEIKTIKDILEEIEREEYVRLKLTKKIIRG